MCQTRSGSRRDLTRAFSIKHGYEPAFDLEVSPRLLEAPISGQAKGKTLGPYLREMVLKYYQLMDWDVETGKPSRKKLKFKCDLCEGDPAYARFCRPQAITWLPTTKASAGKARTEAKKVADSLPRAKPEAPAVTALQF